MNDAPSPDGIESWVLDLDNTLYPPSCGLFHQVAERMTDYVAQLLQLPRAAAAQLRVSYFREHGTTLLGLMRNHKIDPHHYLAFVHDIDYTQLRPDPRLDAALAALPGRKYVFTNGSVAHACAAMDRLGVTARMDGIFDIVAADFLPKPDPHPYRQLVRRFGLAPRHALMADDMPVNLRVPAQLGMTTLWVQGEGETEAGSSTPPGSAGAAADTDYIHHITRDFTGWITKAAGIAAL